MANCIRCGRQMPAFSFKKICPWCVQHEAAQRGELDENARQPVITAPWVQRESTVTLTQVLFGANVMVFIAMVAASILRGEPWLDGFPGELSVHFGANVGRYTLSGQWWRLVTYMFLHGGIMHIAFNMWCLWDLGRLCESLYGRWTFAAIYLITGVAGGLASVAWNPDVLSVGASGAIFGLAGALAASFYLGEFSIPKIAIQGTLRSLLFFIGFNVVFGAMIPGIDNACHGGGLVSGLILGALIARVAPQHDSPRRVGVLVVVALSVVVAAFGVERWRGSDLHFRSAIVAQKNVDRMIAELQKKVKQSPQDASAHYALAHEYFTGRQIPEGIGELKRVLELQPQNANARIDLGAAYLSLGRAKDAQDEFAKFVAQEPNQVDGHAGLGMALADQGNHAAAIEEYKVALRLDPRAGGVYYRMGISQAQVKQYDDAIASFLKEQQLSGDEPEIENALAEAYQAKGMTQQAQAAKNRAVQLRQRD